MFVRDTEVTSDEFLIYFYGSAYIISGVFMWDGILYINF